MAEIPPDEPKDAWSDVMKQVHEALDDAQIDGVALRESLMQGVRRALGNLENVLEAEEEALRKEETSPVVVMEGGRTEDDPSTGGAPPDLRIAEEKGAKASSSETLQAASEEPASTSSVNTTVRVIRAGLGAPSGTGALGGGGPGAARLADAGRIRIEAKAEDAGQTLYRGVESRSYRVHCEEGKMRILLEGQPIETLLPGQSMDIEGCMLRVLSEDGARLLGSFARVALE